MTGIKESMKGDEGAHLSACDVQTQQWVAALTLTGLLMTILVLAGLSGVTASRHVNQVCFRTKMNDGHTLLEASFQTPPEQDAIVEAMRACSL
ncbi:hypothetical protein [Paraburkholderia fynbosensis]|uniref:Uncharacterized protein n=1 Tax=Paraburkholderia fynbosensis TaxID=1200993 RepID=A0A6J5G9D9_9BURK|nr:hypothetical protein [Paraburkholderia fynbosensis]CAB3795678.1 hypothetical protein LMG27177_03899 [Paraburkholderia fynbosensis]